MSEYRIHSHFHDDLMCELSTGWSSLRDWLDLWDELGSSLMGALDTELTTLLESKLTDE